MRTEKKYVKVIDDDSCNKKIEVKAKSEIMKKTNKKQTNKQTRITKKLTRKYGEF